MIEAYSGGNFMKIIVVGGERSERPFVVLVAENHDVILIEKDPFLTILPNDLISLGF